MFAFCFTSTVPLYQRRNPAAPLPRQRSPGKHTNGEASVPPTTDDGEKKPIAEAADEVKASESSEPAPDDRTGIVQEEALQEEAIVKPAAQEADAETIEQIDEAAE